MVGPRSPARPDGGGQDAARRPRRRRHADRIEREARAAARIDDPRVVTVLDLDHDADGTPFLVLEALSGATLADELRSGPLDIGSGRAPRRRPARRARLRPCGRACCTATSSRRTCWSTATGSASPTSASPASPTRPPPSGDLDGHARVPRPGAFDGAAGHRPERRVRRRRRPLRGVRRAPALPWPSLPRRVAGPAARAGTSTRSPSTCPGRRRSRSSTRPRSRSGQRRPMPPVFARPIESPARTDGTGRHRTDRRRTTRPNGWTRTEVVAATDGPAPARRRSPSACPQPASTDPPPGPAGRGDGARSGAPAPRWCSSVVGVLLLVLLLVARHQRRSDRTPERSRRPQQFLDQQLDRLEELGR